MLHFFGIDPYSKLVIALRPNGAKIRERSSPDDASRPPVRNTKYQLTSTFVSDGDTVTLQITEVHLSLRFFELKMFTLI